MREEALAKLRRYCDYQDRCHREVRDKLLSLKVYGEDHAWVVGELLSGGHLNEERFARSFVRGRFRMKGWGRIRLDRELREREIGDYLRRKAMEEIDEEEYERTLESILERHLRGSAPDTPRAEAFNSARQVALRKGYESEVTNRVLERLLPRS